MKKILLCFFFLFSSVYAVDVNFSNPVGSDIGLGNNFPFSNVSYTPEEFCIQSGYTSLINLVPVNSGGTTINYYDGSSWTTASDNQNDMISSITCSAPSGCTNSNSINYDQTAIIDDGSCLSCNTQTPENCSETGCASITYYWDSGSSECRPNQLGCTDSNAENYNPFATQGNPDIYCVYCAITSLSECSNQTDCETQGGQWVDGLCSGSGTSTSGDSEIIIRPPNDSSYLVVQPISEGYYSTVVQKCVSYNSSNLCDSWRWDLSGDFLDFLISLAWKSILGGVFLWLLIAMVYRLFLFLKTFFIGSPRS
jgi:hypothetical protein